VSRRLIWGDFTETHVVKVYRDSEWQEYVARVAAKGQPWYEPADYHTTDKDDAIDSARDMLRRCTEEGVKP